MTETSDRLTSLATLRDWLRYAVSRFNAAGLSYGHGTERALDEAAFLILSSLDLDVDDLDPWLEARLTDEERRRIASLIDARIEQRKPAAYLLGRAWIRRWRFRADERAIVPRSFIGEMIADRLDQGEEHFPPLPAKRAPTRILDMCTGGGSLAILAALAFPEATVDAVDISPPALALAKENVSDYGLGDRVRLFEGDLFSALPSGRYGLIMSNPPYVTEASAAAFPPEHQAEPRLAHVAGADGLDCVRRILASAGGYLEADGQIVVEVGAGQQALEAAFPDLPFVWLDTETASAEVFVLPASALSSPSAPSRRRRKPAG